MLVRVCDCVCAHGGGGDVFVQAASKCKLHRSPMAKLKKKKIPPKKDCLVGHGNHYKLCLYSCNTKMLNNESPKSKTKSTTQDT